MFVLLLLACSDQHDSSRSSPPGSDGTALGVSPSAQRGQEAALREDLAAPRHVSDGGGSASLEKIRSGDSDRALPSIRIAQRARLTIAYHVGPHGIAEGGSVLLQSPPRYGWDPAQVTSPEAAGYTTAATAANDVELIASTLGEGRARFTVRGRALDPGERLTLVYGAGAEFARADTFAEQEERIWIHVDGDGDSVFGLVASSPTIRVEAGRPARLFVHTPTTVGPNEPFEIRVAVLDRAGNAGVRCAGSIRLTAGPGIELATEVVLEPNDEGVARLTARATRPGVYSVRGEARLTSEFDADLDEARIRRLLGHGGPLVVDADNPRILWADLHGHSQLSDGTGTPEAYFDYARDAAGLDVAALTDHDHWGVSKLDAHPARWQRIQRAVRAAHDPDRFVALLGYEWTSWLQGHRHVIYFADRGPIFSSIDRDRRWETPAQLWAALRGMPALTFAHHAGGGPVATNWAYAPDPVLEPVTEIMSVHGSSEAPDSPRPIYQAVAGNFVRDALDLGYRLGFVGSGDGHDGHPGLTRLGAVTQNGGLAAIVAPEATRAAVLEALRSRRTYATSGPRIWLDVTLDDQYPMGAIIPPTPAGARATVEVRTVGTATLERIDLVRAGAVERSIEPGEGVKGGVRAWSGRIQLDPLVASEYLYVRVVQTDRGAAWSSPFFVASEH